MSYTRQGVRIMPTDERVNMGTISSKLNLRRFSVVLVSVWRKHHNVQSGFVLLIMLVPENLERLPCPRGKRCPRVHVGELLSIRMQPNGGCTITYHHCQSHYCHHFPACGESTDIWDTKNNSAPHIPGGVCLRRLPRKHFHHTSYHTKGGQVCSDLMSIPGYALLNGT